MHRSPTGITHGVSGMTEAIKLPPLNLERAMQTEPRAIRFSPSSVQSDRLRKLSHQSHCTCAPNVFLRN
eukprot:357309-Pyramimonas_sp.AAC.1